MVGLMAGKKAIQWAAMREYCWVDNLGLLRVVQMVETKGD